MLVTLLVLKIDKSNEVSDVHAKNVLFILVTLLVLKCLKPKEVIEDIIYWPTSVISFRDVIFSGKTISAYVVPFGIVVTVLKFSRIIASLVPVVVTEKRLIPSI